MIPFYSKRNQVYPTLYQGRAAVEKHFSHLEDWQWETELYTVLAGKAPVPEVLLERPGLSVTAYCPQPTLLEVLEGQEQAGYSPAAWQALAWWLRKCHTLCGKLPLEGNLRNFLWDAGKGEVIGLDLEGFQPTSLETAGGELVAGLLTYAPQGTSVKEQAARLLREELEIPAAQISQAVERLQARRSGSVPRPASGIVLAGGKSQRMGRDKATLELGGKTFLQLQVEKLQALGVKDILVSGGEGPLPSGIARVSDAYPGRGPLGGLHACLQAAQNPSCLVLTVDTPLVPMTALAHLRRAHQRGVTVLCHNGQEEPLIAVMDRRVAQSIQPLIAHNGAPVRALKQAAPWSRWEYRGPEEFLQNCNTPQEYEAITDLFQRYENAFSN